MAPQCFVKTIIYNVCVHQKWKKYVLRHKPRYVRKVTQRATIAHLSPMYLGQIPFPIDISWFSNLFETDETETPWWIMCSYIRLGQSNRYWKNRSFDHPQAELDILPFKKTYKWAMETRGPKSNSSELLCLSWLPATLMMIRSKINELAWRQHFPIISLWEIF